MTPNDIEADVEVRQSPYEMIGGEVAVRRIVDRFYDIMDSAPEAARIRAMHAHDLAPIRERLYEFLSGWLGGPPLYFQRPDHKCIVSAHRAFAIGEGGARRLDDVHAPRNGGLRGCRRSARAVGHAVSADGGSVPQPLMQGQAGTVRCSFRPGDNNVPSSNPATKPEAWAARLTCGELRSAASCNSRIAGSRISVRRSRGSR